MLRCSIVCSRVTGKQRLAGVTRSTHLTSKSSITPGARDVKNKAPCRSFVSSTTRKSHHHQQNLSIPRKNTHGYVKPQYHFFSTAPDVLIGQRDTSYDQLSDESNHSGILACSSTKTIVVDIDELSSASIVEAIISKLRKLSHMAYNFLIISIRGIQISAQLSPMLILTPLAILNRHLDPNRVLANYNDESQGKETYFEHIAWKYFLYSLQALGPAFVKAAQWSATRRDFFHPYVCDHLETLQSNAKTHSWENTEKILEESFGENYKEFLEISPESQIIGSGAIAQVYKAYLKEYGQVAVKILHPNIRNKISQDILLMKAGATFLNGLLPSDLSLSLSLPRAAKTFSDVMEDQINLEIEAEKLLEFRHNFENVSAVKFPKPIEQWTNSSVLIEEYCGNAVPIMDYINSTTDSNKLKIAGTLIRSYMKMLFQDNMVHSDLHPGNILVQPDDMRLVFLDAGISTTLSKGNLQNLKDLFKAVITNDGSTVGRLMVERARFEKCTKIPGGLDEFSSAMENLVSEFHHDRKTFNLNAVKVGSFLKQVLDLCRNYGVEFDPRMSSIVISTIILEGLGRECDPDVDIIKTASPFILGVGEV